MGGVAEGFCAAVELSNAVTWPKASVAEPLREELLQLCRQRLDAFRMQRGEEVSCLLTQKPAASGTGAATARRSAARSKSGCSPGPRAAANAAGQAVAWQTRIKGPWRWTTSCPGTRAGRTTSASCRPSASAAMPAARASPQHGERIAERMLGAAEHVRNSMLGSGQRTNRD